MLNFIGSLFSGFDPGSMFAGAGLLAVGTGLFWVVVRFLLNRFRKPIAMFIASKGIRILARWLDGICDWFRDHGDKPTAKIIRGIAQDSIEKAPKIFREELYDND